MAPYSQSMEHIIRLYIGTNNYLYIISHVKENTDDSRLEYVNTLRVLVRVGITYIPIQGLKA